MKGAEMGGGREKKEHGRRLKREGAPQKNREKKARGGEEEGKEGKKP